MKIVFVSLTGNVRKFVGKVGIDSIELDYSNPCIQMNDHYVLVVPSYDDELTEVVSSFVKYKDNENYLLAISGSGNMNFDKEYCFNADQLSQIFNKPLINKFEFSGTEDDVIIFKREVEKIEVTRTK